MTDLVAAFCAVTGITREQYDALPKSRWDEGEEARMLQIAESYDHADGTYLRLAPRRDVA